MTKPISSANQLRDSQHGMMLLEVMIAILIFAVGVLGMVKMQAVASANSVNSEDRSTAALLANDMVSELWTMWIGTQTAVVPSDYSAWKTRVANALCGGSTCPGSMGGSVVVSGAAAPYTATITITWPRHMGRNVGSGASDNNTTATYITQVMLQ